MENAEMKKQYSRRIAIIAYIFVLLSFVIPVIFLVFRMIFGNHAEHIYVDAFSGEIVSFDKGDENIPDGQTGTVLIGEDAAMEKALSAAGVSKEETMTLKAKLTEKHDLQLYLVTFKTQEFQQEAGYHSYADYVLMILQCLLGVIVLHIPSLLSRKMHFILPKALFYMYLFFLYCAIFLGEVKSFFYAVPHWDVILHAMSSLMTGFFGVMVISILNRDKHVVMRLSPFFVALFSFSFAVMLGAMWEIYEFVFDGLLGLNMQKFILADGTVLAGHEALADTMKDIIVDSIGALIASVFGYIAAKKNLTWFTPEILDASEDNAKKAEKKARKKARKEAKAAARKEAKAEAGKEAGTAKAEAGKEVKAEAGNEKAEAGNKKAEAGTDK